MSFQEMKKEELLAVADAFAVEVKPVQTKASIISELEEFGVTYEQYNKFIGEENPVEETSTLEEEFVSKPTLVKMTRQNPTFEAFGKTFTKTHPFAVVSEDTAQKIIDTFEGFRLASPSEAQEYYG